jgi:C-terminal processing protease CtpA/Prc
LERREHTRQRDRVKAWSAAISLISDARNATRGTVLALALSVACAGSTGTIGAVLGQRPDGRLFIREVPPHLAAARAGVRAGDEVLLIDGRDVRAMSVREVHHLLEGDVGDSVKLTLVRGAEIVRVTLHLTPSIRMSEAPRNPQ